MRAPLDHQGGQRNIGRYHQISSRHAPHDLVVSDIESHWNHEHANIRRARHVQGLIGDQRHHDLALLRLAVKHLLHRPRTSVGIDPDMHAELRFLLYNRSS